ncbi:hypothetical protein ACQEUX_02890 [Micromonospora sp. CA-259024]|uniref:hypothetical protein n=1 Tax=Micromonospora sp. CA-259024 TaxID=3239965 RepID=UPI003D8EF2F3
MSTASESWTTIETDPQRTAILDAADRLLAGTSLHSTGNLSVVQLAIEAQVKYWVVAQRHPDLRNHFQVLAQAARQGAVPPTSADRNRLGEERDQLAQHCAGLEQLIQTYAVVINELATENEALRDQLRTPSATVTPLRRRRRGS